MFVIFLNVTTTGDTHVAEFLPTRPVVKLLPVHHYAPMVLSMPSPFDLPFLIESFVQEFLPIFEEFLLLVGFQSLPETLIVIIVFFCR